MRELRIGDLARATGISVETVRPGMASARRRAWSRPTDPDGMLDVMERSSSSVAAASDSSSRTASSSTASSRDGASGASLRGLAFLGSFEGAAPLSSRDAE